MNTTQFAEIYWASPVEEDVGDDDREVAGGWLLGFPDAVVSSSGLRGSGVTGEEDVDAMATAQDDEDDRPPWGCDGRWLLDGGACKGTGGDDGDTLLPVSRSCILGLTNLL